MKISERKWMSLMKKLNQNLFSLLIIFFLSFTSFANTEEKIISAWSSNILITDGDTIKIGKEKIRLFDLGNGRDFASMMLLWQNHLPSESLNDQIQTYKEYNKDLGFNKNFDYNDLRSFDIKNYLYSNILKKSDISWMLNSIEVRPVFLDDRIFNFAHEIDNSNNFNFLNTKTFLKDILKAEIKDYNFQKKHGFSHDFGDWTYNVGLKYLEKEWSDFEEVNRLISYLKNNNENKYFASRYIWKFYSLFKWIEKNNITV